MSEETFDRLCMLPNGWLVKTINDITIRVGSGVTPTGGSEVYSDSGVIFVRSQNVTNSGLLLDDVAFIDTLTHEKMRSSELLPFDVLLNITGASIGRCCVFPQEIGSANVNQHVCTIRLKSPNYMEAKFLALLFVSPLGQNQIFRLNAGGNREGLNYQQIRSMCFSFPPLPQQRKIAKILTTVDNLIEKTEQLIAKYQSIKQGMMHDLFTRGIDAKGKLRPPQSEAPELYKQSELGWIPKDWEVDFGHNLFHLYSGTSPTKPREDSSGDCIFLKVDDFNSSDNYYGLQISKISFDASENPSTYVYPPGLIVFPKRGAAIFINRAQRLLKTGTVDPNLMLLETGERLDPEWMRLHLLFMGLGNICDNSGIPQINNKHLYPLRLRVPDRIEQEKIAAIHGKHDVSIRYQKESLNKLRAIKIALMQDLLTGKIQVSPDADDKELAHA